MQISARQRGFTLIELMVTLAVVAIVAALGVPSFQNHLKDNRRIAQVNEIVSAMNLARSEATKGNGTVAFCPSADEATCSGGNYDTGWIVFINSDGDTPPAVDGGERILRTHAGSPVAGTSLRATAGAAAGINFLASGRPATFGDVTYCDDRGAGHARTVVLNLVGVIRASGVHGDGSGLACP
ncbi:MAG: GspH/FimT family pseudopilin [Gammaproteobacteria bacterium]